MENYGSERLDLVVAGGYLKKLMENETVLSYVVRPAETVAIAAEFGFRFLPGPPDSLACETHGRKHLQSAAVWDLSVELSGIPRSDNHKRENLMRHWVAVVRRELGRKPPADG